MIRLFFLIRALDVGGAQRQLTELVKRLDKTRFRVTVATFYDGGGLRSEIEGIEGVAVVSLHKKGRWDVGPFLWRLAREVYRAKPQIIHGYMGVANELSLIAGRIVGAKVVWGLRAADMDLTQYDWLVRRFEPVGRSLSRFADLIIVNSCEGKRHHISLGYHSEQLIVIHNGFDTERFGPDPQAGRHTRCQWGIAETQTLIGLVGRLDPMKGHPTFLHAAAMLARERPDVRFVCVGDGPERYKRKLHALAHNLGIGEVVVWAGSWSNMPAAYNALDILTSASSYGEGFPNVIGEAMACGVPCVVTRVGDSAVIVGDTGHIVAAEDPNALKVAWSELLGIPKARRAAVAISARERILDNFTVQHLVEQTQRALIHQVCKQR